jgi:methylenetetrahydrofolate dehydrogenase (NADP+)/methenyltetrahydrofolate cyclohydrolase
MQILDGKKVSQAVKDQLKIDVAQLFTEGKKVPHLAAILVGNDGASETYVASKVKSCEEVGFKSTLIRFEADISEHLLLEKIQELNHDPDVDGILVQLPLPKHISDDKVINTIDPDKDVDGFHPVSVGKMVQGLPTFIPATPHGIMLMLEHYKINTAGMHAVVIGRSNIVGRPMSILLSENKNPGQLYCHTLSFKNKKYCRALSQCRYYCCSLGRPGFVTEDWVKEGAIVIDVGITRVADATKKSGFRLRGDVDYDTVAPKCLWITPVPGGVGPMTIAALLNNTYRSCMMMN